VDEVLAVGMPSFRRSVWGRWRMWGRREER
jgi:hypothetical protein